MIAAVDGYALGGGMELILAADITIAAKTAKIGVPTINLGGIPCWTATQLLPRIVGPSCATDILLTGRMLSAEECYRLHLRYQLFFLCSLSALTFTCSYFPSRFLYGLCGLFSRNAATASVLSSLL